MVENFQESREEILPENRCEQVDHQAMVENMKDGRGDAFFAARAIPPDEPVGSRLGLLPSLRNLNEIAFQNLDQLFRIKGNAIVLH